MTDNVTIKLNDREVIRVTNYRVVSGIFEQPGRFEVTIGRPYQYRFLASEFPPKTPYKLYLNDRLIQSGLIDAVSRAGSSTKTETSLRGRDMLAHLVDTEVDKDASFAESTYFELTEKALENSGTNALLSAHGLGEAHLEGDNEANRKAITGKKRVRATPQVTTESVETEISRDGNTRLVNNTIKAEVGTKWWQFLVEQYRRVGLFLWCGHDGKLILASPDVDQDPIYKLIRTEQEANIAGDSFANDTARRHTECIVYGRQYKSSKTGAGKVMGRFIDDEMVALYNPREEDRVDGGVIKVVKTIKDKKVKSSAHAANLARREIAEERRNGWRLSYVFRGHTLEEIGTGFSVVPAPDTIVVVNDDDLGLYGKFYIEAVEFNGNQNNTTTRLTLLRVDDVFFRAEVPSTRAAHPVPNVSEPMVSHPGIALYQDRFGVPIGLDSNWEYPVVDGLEGAQERDEYGNAIGPLFDEATLDRLRNSEPEEAGSFQVVPEGSFDE